MPILARVSASHPPSSHTKLPRHLKLPTCFNTAPLIKILTRSLLLLLETPMTSIFPILILGHNLVHSTDNLSIRFSSFSYVSAIITISSAYCILFKFFPLFFIPSCSYISSITSCVYTENKSVDKTHSCPCSILVHSLTLIPILTTSFCFQYNPATVLISSRLTL